MIQPRRGKRTQRENPCPQPFVKDFNNQTASPNCSSVTISLIIPRQLHVRQISLFTPAPASLHPPVNRLHSAEFQAHATAHFPLTANIEGVKQTRSLTTSEVFPVGAASGARAKSLSASQDDGEKAGKGL